MEFLPKKLIEIKNDRLTKTFYSSKGLEINHVFVKLKKHRLRKSSNLT
ncbi:hypothetical protein EV06_2002 [Prochlorococcus sp. MIT 0602]|nr:hypothetical protein EV06_2002 [Prochlorococcus sp. MIT 0602]KGG15631.1 hypothetical protein EV07_1596 [Prochlorococcus sp. MIT 0603]